MKKIKITKRAKAKEEKPVVECCGQCPYAFIRENTVFCANTKKFVPYGDPCVGPFNKNGGENE